MNDVAIAPRNAEALVLAITHLPFGLAALTRFLEAESEIGPLTSNFEDLLLDNLPLSQKQAKAIADIYRQLPHVARNIEAERLAREEPDDDYPGRCTSPDGKHDWSYTGTAYGGDDERWMGEGRCLCTYCGADGDA